MGANIDFHIRKQYTFCFIHFSWCCKDTAKPNLVPRPPQFFVLRFSFSIILPCIILNEGRPGNKASKTLYSCRSAFVSSCLYLASISTCFYMASYAISSKPHSHFTLHHDYAKLDCTSNSNPNVARLPHYV